MPLIKLITSGAGCVGVWKIDETAGELTGLSGAGMCDDLSGVSSPKRLREKCAVRALLYCMLQHIGEKNCAMRIHYREDGSPYLDGKLFISISHTDGYAAVFLNTGIPVGVDIETRSPRALKLVSRFEAEGGKYADPDSATVCWSAKECVFKLLGEEFSDFRKTMHIRSFSPVRSGILRVGLCGNRSNGCCDVNYCIDNDYVLTWVS